MEEELKSLPEVARRIFLDCKKCQCGRYHVVIAHSSKTSAKVECEVCKSKKTFKLASAKKSSSSKSRVTTGAAAAKKTRGGSKASAGKHLEKFVELKHQFGGGTVLPYKMTVRFVVNSAIEHPKFGLGIVTEVGSQSIQVTFQDEDRSLVHGRG